MSSPKRLDPSRFESNNGTKYPTTEPAPPNRTWGELLNEEAGLYLASPEWAARKAQYFAWIRTQGFEPACQVCFVMLKDAADLGVHHHSYTGVLVARPHRTEFVAWEDHAKLVPLCREHHAQVHKHLAKITSERGYMVSDTRWSESYESLRAVRKIYEKAPASERLGFSVTTPPNPEPPTYAPKRHSITVRR